MEARLVDAPAGGVAVQYFQDGRLLVAAPFATRADAQADADARLKDLLRAGWATHW